MTSSKLPFKNGISYNDLQTGYEFEVEEKNESSSDEDIFDDELFASFKQELVNLENAAASEDDSFEALKAKMEPLTEDGLVLKKLVKVGMGEPIPAKAIVLMHYNGYVENEAEPFDSTYRRSFPFKFLLGDGKIIPGLDLAVATMKTGEISKFIIGYEYAYGELGCPPRIPSKANLLYEVEIVNFINSAVAIEYEEMAPEERKRAAFEKIVALRNLENKMASDLVDRKLYKPAIARYRKMAEMLEDVSVKDETEDKKRLDYLLKVYLNLAHCYLCIKNAVRTLKYADLALKLDDNNIKALYRKGKGLLLNNEFEKSKIFLLRAHQLKPYDKAINAALKEHEILYKKGEMTDRLFWQRAFNSDTKDEPKAQLVQECPEMKEFQITIEKKVEEFIDSSEKEYSFSPYYTEAEVEVIETAAKKYGLAFFKKIHDNQKIIKICKNDT